MDDFAADAEITHRVITEVNGIEIETVIKGCNWEDISEQWHKIDNAVSEELTSQFYDDYDYDSLAKHNSLMEAA